MEIAVENIKCGGCANTITTKMKALDGVNNVVVDIEQGTVTIDGDVALRDTYAKALSKMGYPETGSVQGLDSVGAKAKSFVSCAVGRINN
ncbi:MAG: heavy metal-associated domain-containing protein [Sedimenticola sp.]